MKRRVHFAVERLSPKGLEVVHRGLRENAEQQGVWTYQRIVKAVKAATGESVAPSSLARYAARWEMERNAVRESQEQAAAIVAELKQGSMTAAEVTEALVTSALLKNRDALALADPVKLSREERERQKLELKRQELELRAREIAFNERKLEALEAKQRAIEEKAKEVMERVKLNPDEAAKQVRELYGLTQ